MLCAVPLKSFDFSTWVLSRLQTGFIFAFSLGSSKGQSLSVAVSGASLFDDPHIIYPDFLLKSSPMFLILEV
jgi:hypothetical protein